VSAACSARSEGGLAASRSWYERLFDLRLIFEFPDERGVVRGVAYEVPGLGGAGLALRERPDIAGLSGFDPVIFAVNDRAAVDAWCSRLDELGVPHRVELGTIGWVVHFSDPDGLEIALYSREHHEVADVGSGRRVVRPDAGADVPLGA
jgi:catechol 2,3-dioxygenase-like lactoylglutathione lyase family enzyme